jgi:glutamate N-acetyltransferase/amino-acid N-acetyltransferase
MTAALPELTGNLSADNGFALAETIMTTDLVPKWTCVQGYIDGRKITIAGINKGSGMIAPNMATMLCFMITDAAVKPEILQKLWSEVAENTFNKVTVDTDTSTNDTAVILASGIAGNTEISAADSQEALHFKKLLFHAANPLAKMMAADGEGATKLIKVTAEGFGDKKLCDTVARTIAESPLVKTAMFGCDPNWGRIIAAAGRSGADFDPSDIDISICGITVLKAGTPQDFDAELLAVKLKAGEVYIDIFCGKASGRGHCYTCDYSYDYIKINADYHT